MYDSMSMPLIEKTNQVYETEGAEAAACVLIDYYKGEAKDRIHQIHHKSKELLLRYEQIKNALLLYIFIQMMRRMSKLQS